MIKKKTDFSHYFNFPTIKEALVPPKPKEFDKAIFIFFSFASFGTEAGLFQEIGISTVVCGPGSIKQAHKIDEFIKLSEIKKCISFLDGIKNKSLN